MKNKKGEGYVSTCVMIVVICMLLSVFVTFAVAVNTVKTVECNSRVVLDSFVMQNSIEIYIDAGVIPKYAGTSTGVNWFKERGQWLDGSAEPSPGMIIFYDWAKNGLDGQADHTAIVWKVENGYVYTIEGNWDDQCQTSCRPIGEYQILGYGVPAY